MVPDWTTNQLIDYSRRKNEIQITSCFAQTSRWEGDDERENESTYESVPKLAAKSRAAKHRVTSPQRSGLK
jgi:hypothetical protein